MTGFKKILAMTTMLALLVAPTASFGATEKGAEEQAPITMMKSELIREGFSQSNYLRCHLRFRSCMKL